MDDATITLLTNETKDRAGALPLLQFSLTRIWEGITRGVAPSETYRLIGGVGGALAGEAQRIYDGLDATQQRIVKRVFLSLVQLGEGTRDTRRRAVVESLVSFGENAEQVENVIRRFAERDARLITLSADEQGAGDTAEVTHEALFDHWQELNHWLESSREDIRFSRRLQEAARSWDQEGRPDGSLWRRPKLDLLRDFYDRMASEMNPLQMDFYLASDQGEQARVAKERRQQIIKRALLGVSVSAALLAIAMLVWALFSRNEAITSRNSIIRAMVDSISTSPPATAGERITNLNEAATSTSLREHAIEQLQSTFDTQVPPSVTREERESLTSGKANIAVGLLGLGEIEQLWPLLKHSDNPALRTYLIHRLSQAGADAETIAAQMDDDHEPSVLQVVILSLGEFDQAHFPSNNRETLIPKLVDFYRDHADPAVHAASEWLLRKWGREDQLSELAESLHENESQLRARKAEDTREWYINTQGQTMVLIEGPVTFDMGSPWDKPGHEESERLHATSIEYSFAIAAHEVTVAQFLKFRKDHDYDREYTQDDRCAVNMVSWYDAAAYCNWLSGQEGIDESQWCYRPNAEGTFAQGMTMVPDYVSEAAGISPANGSRVGI